MLVLAGCALWVGNKAIDAKNHLQAAQTDLKSFKNALGQPDAPSTVQLYQKVQSNTSRAQKDAQDPLWHAAESVPKVGVNLRAFRQVATMLNTLVSTGIKPVAYAADGISVNSLKPKDGALDIAPLKKLTPAIATLDTALRTADATGQSIDTRGTVSQIAKPVASLHTTIAKVLPVTAELKKVMPLFYPALGGDGKRHYIMMFQNNAEERASGGNPAALAMLDVDDGKVKLGRQPNSNDFPHPYLTPPVNIKGDWDKLYGAHASSYVTNITFTPDFPTTAKLVRAMWKKQYGGKVDGVISFDPVALSYLMQATGPIKLKNGKTLTSKNAVSYLLSGVYAQYPRYQDQNLVFASAAQAIFKAVTHGQGKPGNYIKELTPMLNEQRLKAWSVRKDEEAALMTSQAGNMLPVDNTKATTVGVYNNDDSTSKMSYYMHGKIAVKGPSCTAKKPKYTVTETVENVLQWAQVPGLPHYVLAGAKRVVKGTDRQYVVLYGPVGSKLTSMTVDGAKVVWGTNIAADLNTNYLATGAADFRPAVKGTDKGRPVGIVSITVSPRQSVKVVGHFSGAKDPSKTIAVSHTPKVRDVPVTISQPSCS